MKRLLSLLAVIALISGCSTEEQPTQFTCTNALVPGEDGFFTVGRFFDSTNNETVIGYRNGTTLVKHNECGPAVIKRNGNETTYSYFQHGTETQTDGVHSLRFYVDSNFDEALEAKRIVRTNVADVEDGTLNDIRYIKWSREGFNAVVIAEDNFNGNTERQVTITIGNTDKIKKYNGSTTQWDCEYYRDGGLQFSDPACTNEVANDLTYLGVTYDVTAYVNTLDNQSRSYETDKDKLDEKIDRYF